MFDVHSKECEKCVNEENMPVKVYYFPAHGRAQQIRFTLVQGGIDFVDVMSKGFPATEEET